MPSENRRRTIVVNKVVQNRIVFATTWAPVLCLMLTAILLGHYASRMTQEADGSAASLLPLLLLGFLLVSAALFVFNALSFSHRVAGPGYHIGKVLNAVREGKLGSRIHLRQGDFLTEVANEINDFLEWLEAHPPQGVTPGSAAGTTEPTAEPTTVTAAQD